MLMMSPRLTHMLYETVQPRNGALCSTHDRLHLLLGERVRVGRDVEEQRRAPGLRMARTWLSRCPWTRAMVLRLISPSGEAHGQLVDEVQSVLGRVWARIHLSLYLGQNHWHKPADDEVVDRVLLDWDASSRRCFLMFLTQFSQTA